MAVRPRIIAILLIIAPVPSLLMAQPRPLWTFAVSGDSRNCGDIVMPAIASAVLRSGASFYWHLGDFRAIYDFDEDMAPPSNPRVNFPRLTITNYLMNAWPDFIDHQVRPFGS